MEHKSGGDLWPDRKFEWPDRKFEWVWREDEGRSGGLISIWNRKRFVKTSSWHSRGVLVVNGRWVKDNEEMVVINVYAPCDFTDKALVWDMINLVITQNTAAKICVAGDFNSIRAEGERC
ncbi:hypothetical protein ACS0TY_011339 [Phlomoides rotata]